MDLFTNLQTGFTAAATLSNLFYAFLGCLLGTLVGVLPGLGPLATIAMLLPFTFDLDPTAALIMLAGIYYGSAYGGSTTAILVNLPGETSSVITMIDGNKMARNGRAGVAIVAAALGSFVAGCVGTLVLAAVAAPMAQLAFEFGPAEYFSLMVVGLIGAISLSHGSVLKSVGMILFGVLLGLIGLDVSSGLPRFTFGSTELWDGIEFTVLAVGFFAIGEIVASLNDATRKSDDAVAPMGQLLPNREDVARMTPSVLRGTAIGSVVGVLPGAGLTLASFFAYALERKVSKHRDQIGHGAIEGVAAPESANNAAAQTAFIPTLTLGIPGSATMAMMLGAMVMHDIQPGPRVMVAHPELFWGLIVSMWIGNLILVILNLPLVGIWVRLLSIPYRLLFPAILLFSVIGVYVSTYSTFSVFLAAGLGFLGYAFRQLDCEPAPLILGFVLGPMLETSFRRALVLSEGNFAVFVLEPISAVLLAVAAVMIVVASLPKMTRRRKQVLEEQ